MTTLAQILLAPERREAISGKLAAWIERYVHERGGIKGLALKAGVKALQAVRPDALPRGVDLLLPEFAQALEPLFQRFRKEGGKDFGAFVAKNLDEATDAVMAVTDRRAAHTRFKALSGAYQRLRGTLEGELRSVLPKLVARL